MSGIRSLIVALAGLWLALSLTACAPATTVDANSAFCQSSAVVQAEVAKLKSLVTSGTATTDQVEEQREVVQKAAEAMATDAAKLGDTVAKAVSAVEQAFDQALRAIPSDMTIDEAAPAYQAAIIAWDAAMVGLRATVGCA